MYPNLRCLTCFLKINDNFLKKEEILEFFTFQYKNLHFRKILELKIFFFKIIFRGGLYMVFRYQSMFHPAPYKLIYIFFSSYLRTQESRRLKGHAEFSTGKYQFYSRREPRRFSRTICCYKLSRIIPYFHAYGSRIKILTFEWYFFY